jgi:hypothetical protein
MLENIKGLSSWCHKGCKVIYKFWRRIVKQDELNCDLKFTTVIGFGGGLPSYWIIKKKTILKMKRICGNYINPILKSDVGQMSFKNRRKTCKA